MTLNCFSDLQMQYSTYKNTLQQLAQKIGDVEQEKEEHKYVGPMPSSFILCSSVSSSRLVYLH